MQPGLVCAGDTLSFHVNRVTLATVQDSDFTGGKLAVSVTTFAIKGVGVSFEILKVTVPDPANPPGGLVAPTAVPTVAPTAAQPAGCHLTGYSLEVLTGGLIIHYSADGFAPGEHVVASALGTGSDGNTVKVLVNVQADAQGHIQGELGALPTDLQGITITWAFNLEGLTRECMVNRSAVP